jgi:hypothetical protein
MNLKSLGYRTDLIFASFDGEITDRGDYLAIRSPTNPDFYWGNFLLFSRWVAGLTWRDLLSEKTERSQGRTMPEYVTVGFPDRSRFVMVKNRHPKR